MKIINENGQVQESEEVLIPEMVKINENLYVGKFTITCEEWLCYCADTGTPVPDDNGWGRGRMPVTNINLFDMCRYVNWLNEKVGGMKVDGKYVEFDFRYEIDEANNTVNEVNPNGKGYKIPSSEDVKLFAGDVDEQPIDEVAWYYDNSGGQAHEVGLKKPNKYGIYDLRGNVWEPLLDPEV